MCVRVCECVYARTCVCVCACAHVRACARAGASARVHAAEAGQAATHTSAGRPRFSPNGSHCMLPCPFSEKDHHCPWDGYMAAGGVCRCSAARISRLPTAPHRWASTSSCQAGQGTRAHHHRCDNRPHATLSRSNCVPPPPAPGQRPEGVCGGGAVAGSCVTKARVWVERRALREGGGAAAAGSKVARLAWHGLRYRLASAASGRGRDPKVPPCVSATSPGAATSHLCSEWPQPRACRTHMLPLWQRRTTQRLLCIVGRSSAQAPAECLAHRLSPYPATPAICIPALQPLARRAALCGAATTPSTMLRTSPQACSTSQAQRPPAVGRGQPACPGAGSKHPTRERAPQNPKPLVRPSVGHAHCRPSPRPVDRLPPGGLGYDPKNTILGTY